MTFRDQIQNTFRIKIHKHLIELLMNDDPMQMTKSYSIQAAIGNFLRFLSSQRDCLSVYKIAKMCIAKTYFYQPNDLIITNII